MQRSHPEREPPHPGAARGRPASGTGRPSWRTGPGGVSSAEANGYRLVVQAPEEVGGSARFQVLRQGAEDGTPRSAMVGSGFGADVRAAMAAAERMAERFSGRPLGRG